MSMQCKCHVGPGPSSKVACQTNHHNRSGRFHPFIQKPQKSVCYSERNGSGSGTDETSTNGSAAQSTDTDVTPPAPPAATAPPGQRRSGKRQAESTDWVATQLTRRFGIFGGLAWVGVLAFGVISEQLKTRQEVAAEEANTLDVANGGEVVTPEGLRYTDLRVGGGGGAIKGYLIILDYKAYANGELFEDTKARGKPIVFRYKSRPFTGGVCAGVEMALEGMKTGGVRRVIIPPEVGFGERGATLRPTVHVPGKEGTVPPNATLEYELSLLRVSIPPA